MVGSGKQASLVVSQQFLLAKDRLGVVPSVRQLASKSMSAVTACGVLRPQLEMRKDATLSTSAYVQLGSRQASYAGTEYARPFGIDEQRGVAAAPRQRYRCSTVFDFIQSSQSSADLWRNDDGVGLLRRLWTTLIRAPRCISKEDRIAVSYVFCRYAERFASRRLDICERQRGPVFMGWLTDSHCSHAVSLALAIILRNSQNRALCLTSLAAQLRLSPWHLCRLLNRETGFGLLTHLNGLRTLQAVMSLRDTHRWVKEIANDIGYSSTGQFERQFRGWTGMSPSEFRAVSSFCPPH